MKPIRARQPYPSCRILASSSARDSLLMGPPSQLVASRDGSIVRSAAQHHELATAEKPGPRLADRFPASAKKASRSKRPSSTAFRGDFRCSSWAIEWPIHTTEMYATRNAATRNAKDGVVITAAALMRSKSPLSSVRGSR